MGLWMKKKTHMEFTEEMQSYLDIDWFAVDEKGNILHVASMQGKLPDSVDISVEDNSLLCTYIGALDAKFSHYDFDRAGEIMKREGLRMDNFVFYAQRGIFSFDKSDVNNPSDPIYDRIAIPKKPLMYEDLLPEIQKLISRTVFKGDVSKVSSFNVDEVV